MEANHAHGGRQEEDFEERLGENVLYTFSVFLRKNMKSLLKTVRVCG